LLGKPILDGDVFSFNPSKLAQLLPKRLQADLATGSSTIIQETNAEDFSRLRVGYHSNSKQRHYKQD